MKKVFVLIFIFLTFLFSTTCLSDTLKSEGLQTPIKVSSKYGSYVYLNLTNHHNYVVKYSTKDNKEIERIPIKVKYYYEIRSSLFLLGEDNVLYGTNKHLVKTKVLLTDINSAASTDKNGKYAYALDKKGILYSISADSFEIKTIHNNVINLYSAYSNWVVYQTSDKKWWKQFTNQNIIPIEHKSDINSPYIGNPISEQDQIMEGPWRIVRKHYKVAGNWHGGQQLYDYFEDDFWEYKDGISGAIFLYSVSEGAPYMVVLGSDENNLYILNFEEDSSDYSKIYDRIYRITPTAIAENSDKSKTGKINYECIYEGIQNECTYEKILIETKNFHWTPYGGYHLSNDSKNVNYLSLKGGTPLSILHSEGILTYVDTVEDKVYFKESLSSGFNYWQIDSKNNSIEKVENAPQGENEKWQIYSENENILNQYNLQNKFVKTTGITEGQNIYIYSKGTINSLYFKDSHLFIYRGNTTSPVGDLIKSGIDLDNSFSKDGWIYIMNIDGCYSRFQPDNPKEVQTMPIKFNSPVFESQTVIGFYQDSLCHLIWSTSKIEIIKKLDATSSNYSNLISTSDRYIFYNTNKKCIESVIKKGEIPLNISGKLNVKSSIWYQYGYIYFQNDQEALYRVLPNGKSLTRIYSQFCKPINFTNNKIYCEVQEGLIVISSTGKDKHVIIKRTTRADENEKVKTFDEIYISPDDYISFSNVEFSGNRIIVNAQQAVINPDSDDYATEDVVYSLSLNYKNKIKLPYSSHYNLIDSWYYYINAKNRTCRIDLDGKNNRIF